MLTFEDLIDEIHILEKVMFRKLILASMIGTASIAVSLAALADNDNGPYISAGVGLGGLDFSSIGLTKQNTEPMHTAARFTVGYRLTRHWGVAAGYTRIGHFNNRYRTTISDVFFSGSAHAAWLALTARLPFTKRIALLSDIKLTRNWVDQSKQSAGISQFRHLDGAQTSLVLRSLGAEFMIDNTSTINFQFDGFGEAADAVEMGTLTLNYQYHF